MTEQERDADDPWLTLAEIAVELRVNPATVRQWVSKGLLPASRAGVRKWIVRRSDLQRMLVATNPPPEIAGDLADRPRVPEREVAPPEAGSADATSAIALYQIAGQSFESAFAACAYAPPSAGYLDRVRRFADSCEHLAATMLNASRVAGVGWRGQSNFLADSFPYEIRDGGNRPGSAELWRDYDAAAERLGIAASGTDVGAVAYAMRAVGERLMAVADVLERGDIWQDGSKVG